MTNCRRHWYEWSMKLNPKANRLEKMYAVVMPTPCTLVSRPLVLGGDISLIYTGVFDPRMPAPTPEMIRATMNMAMWTLPAIRAPETMSSTAARAVAARRPYFFANHP